MPLNQIAQVHAPEPQLITVQPFDPSSLAAIEKGIRTADLGLNPMNDGKIIRVPVPPLTEERRKDMVKHLHKMLEEHRTAVRNIRRDGNDAIKKATKDKKIAEDDEKRNRFSRNFHLGVKESLKYFFGFPSVVTPPKPASRAGTLRYSVQK